jgi:hypothetical protein
MESRAPECGTTVECVVLLRYFRDLPSPRQRRKVVYPLDEVVHCVCSQCWSGRGKTPDKNTCGWGQWLPRESHRYSIFRPISLPKLGAPGGESEAPGIGQVP